MRRYFVAVTAALAPLLCAACLAVVDFDKYDTTPETPDAIVIPADAAPPTHAASSIAFRDEDPRTGFVGGTVTIGRATDESDVTAYDLFWTKADGSRAGRFAVVAKTGADPTFPFPKDFALPPDVTGMIAVSERDGAAMETGPSADLVDNHPHEVSIAVPHAADGGGGGLCQGTACNPVVVVDPSPSPRLVVVAQDGTRGGGPVVYRCLTDGTQCAFFDIGANTDVPPNGGNDLSAAVDVKNGRLLVTAAARDVLADWGLFVCNLDATGCVFHDERSLQDGRSANALVDTVNGKVLVVVENSNGDMPALLVCDPDGTGCSPVDVSVGGTAAPGLTAVVDAAAKKLLFVTNDSAGPLLFACDLDGANCAKRELVVPGVTPSVSPGPLALDPVNDKILVPTPHGVLRCANDGTACQWIEAFGALVKTGTDGVAFAQTVVDTAHGAFFAVFEVSGSSSLWVVRCRLDGSSCSPTFDLGTSAGDKPVSAIDPVSQRLVIVTEDANHDPHLTWLSTW